MSVPGNVLFDQVRGSMVTLARVLAFEKSLRLLAGRVIERQEGNGRPIYFNDADAGSSGP